MAYSGPAHLIVNPDTDAQRVAVVLDVTVREIPPGPANRGSWDGTFVATAEHHGVLHEAWMAQVDPRLDLLDDGRTGRIMVRDIRIDSTRPLIRGTFVGTGMFPA